MNASLAKRRPAEILHVEDDAGMAELTRVVFERSPIAVNLHHVTDGEECMAFLHKEGSHLGAPTPDIILLDLNMPRMGGREVLAEITRDEQLRHLPVVVLTSSPDEQEVLSMYKLRCSSYILKTIDFQEFERAIHTLIEYWLTVVVLPVST